MAGEVHEGDSVAARVGDPAHLDPDHGARADDGPGAEPGRQLCETLLVPRHHRPAPMQADDTGRAGEGTEHQDDAAVLSQVGDGLYAAAGAIEVGHLGGAEHGELTVVALRRAVHMALGAERRRGDEEDRLGLEEPPQALVYHVVGTSHGVAAPP